MPDAGFTALFGVADENLRAIEEAFSVRLAARGNEVSVVGTGEGEDAARRLLAAFSDLAAMGYPLKGSDVATAIRVLKENPSASLVEFFTESPFGPSLRSVVSARNNKQRLYVQTIDRHDLVFAIGPAGTGKTYLAVAMAAAALLEKKVKRIVLARPAVEAGERLGFLPGDLSKRSTRTFGRSTTLSTTSSDTRGRRSSWSGRVIEVAPSPSAGRTLTTRSSLRRGAEHDVRADEDVSDPHRFRLESRGHGDVTQVDLPRGRPRACGKHQLLGAIAGIRFVFDERAVVRHPLVQSISTPTTLSTVSASRRSRGRPPAAASLDVVRGLVCLPSLSLLPLEARGNRRP